MKSRDYFCIYIIDNLERRDDGISAVTPIAGEDIPVNAGDKTVRRIHEFILRNLAEEDPGTYGDDELRAMLALRTLEKLSRRIAEGYLIYLEDRSGEIIACGILVKNKGRFESKSLHVDRGFRGRGLARFISDLREKRAVESGAVEIYIESLKFPRTVDFHLSRGYLPEAGERPLKYSVFMKKGLK